MNKKNNIFWICNAYLIPFSTSGRGHSETFKRKVPPALLRLVTSAGIILLFYGSFSILQVNVNVTWFVLLEKLIYYFCVIWHSDSVEVPDDTRDGFKFDSRSVDFFCIFTLYPHTYTKIGEGNLNRLLGPPLTVQLSKHCVLSGGIL